MAERTASQSLARSEPDELEQSDGLDLENRRDPSCKKEAQASRISATSDAEELESDGVDLEKGHDPPSKKEVPASWISTVLYPDKIDESDVADLEIGSDLLCKKEVPARRILPLSESSPLLMGLVESKAVPPDFNNIFASSDTGGLG